MIWDFSVQFSCDDFPDPLSTIHVLLLQNHLSHAVGTAVLTGCKATLFPSLSQHNSVSSPPTRPWARHRAGPMCRASGTTCGQLKGDRHGQKYVQIFINKICIFTIDLIYPLGKAGGVRYKPTKARGAVQ